MKEYDESITVNSKHKLIKAIECVLNNIAYCMEKYSEYE